MSWNKKSYFSGQSGNNRYSADADADAYEGGQHEVASGKKRPSSRLKKSSSKKAEDEYPSYHTNRDGDDDNYNNNYGGYTNGGSNGNGYGYGSTVPYYGGGGYNYGGGGYAGRDPIPYNNAPPAPSWAPQDGSRSPMFINTKEVNVYATPELPYDDRGYNNDQRRGGGGFFRPAFEAVGNFFDRRFGFNDRD